VVVGGGGEGEERSSMVEMAEIWRETDVAGRWRFGRAAEEATDKAKMNELDELRALDGGEREINLRD
jgi:hypothetical protein